MTHLEQRMRRRDREMVPRALVQAMFALMLASLALVAFAQWTDRPNVGVLVEAPIVEELAVTLTGDRSGTYVATAADGTVLAVSSGDMNGFIGVMGRVIDRERLVHRVEGNPPLRVVRRENGHVAILDDATGMATELIGYGADNVAAFARLLD